MTSAHALRVRLASAVIAAGAIALALISPGGAPVRAAQKDKGDAPNALAYLGAPPTKATAGDLTADINGCGGCHSGANVKSAVGFVNSFKSHEFVRLDEAVIWGEKDIHSAAYNRLDSQLGKDMEKVLQKHRPAGYKVTSAPECLTCHAVDYYPTKALTEKKPDDFDTFAGGVNCTVCHGLHSAWQADHYKAPKQKGQGLPWRGMTPAEKYTKGMTDLRNPVVKAKLCVSCHVGNAAEGKVVTHEIYAAGHPPLPPFEMSAYMEGEPRHWGYPSEMKYFDTVKKEDTWKMFHFHAGADEAYLARHYAAGAIAAVQAEAELLLADATRALKDGDILDYARFDCYSCHHELRYPSDRQKRGYDGPPGRAPLRAAAGVPAGVVAENAKTSPSKPIQALAPGFGPQWAKLKAAALERPFGKPASVQTEAKALWNWCESFLKEQGDTAEPLFPQAQAQQLRGAVVAAATGREALADPEAAMVLTWGALALTREGGMKHDKAKLDALDAIISENVRIAPFSKEETRMDMKLMVPVQAQFPPRMKRVAKFEAATYEPAFKAVFGK